MAMAHQSTALILSGGGARAAYQVGVLRAISDMMTADCANPFGIVCGTSAGGLNAAGLATKAGCLRHGVELLEQVWGNFHTNQVYRTDWPGVLHRAFRFLWTMAFGRVSSRLPVSLLNNQPLRELLEQTLDFTQIQQAINQGHLGALCLTSSGYTSGESVSFFQGDKNLQGWRRSRRLGISTSITVDHLMATAAIPIIFPPVLVHREYFADGAMRQLSPLSPALHLGADRVLVIGVSGQQRNIREHVEGFPSIAHVVSHILNSSFIDSLEADIERLNRINKTLSLIPSETLAQQSSLRHVETLVIAPPAEKLDQIAMQHAEQLPKSIRMFVRGSGATHRSGSGILSYLLFEASYCKDLMALGYQDAMARRSELEKFLHITPSDEVSNVVAFKRAEN